MALIVCSECGRHISDKAPSCPGCGTMTRAGGIKQAIRSLVLLPVMIAMLVIGYDLLVPSRPATRGDSAPAQAAAADGPSSGHADTVRNPVAAKISEEEQNKLDTLTYIGPTADQVVISACSKPGDDGKMVPGVTCQKITPDLLKSLKGLSRDQVVAIMGASGRVFGSSISYFSNDRSDFDPQNAWASDNVILDFDRQKVTLIMAQAWNGMSKRRKWEWARDNHRIADYACSDFPDGDVAC